ncbi:MAG: hypothetical protein KC731_37250 [Myxococcales bacterium]|nr:hypothetical protein [Myxococcales bacterium]
MAGCGPCASLEVVKDPIDGTESRRVTTYLSTDLEASVVAQGPQKFLDVQYAVDGDVLMKPWGKETAEIAFTDDHVERLTALRPAAGAVQVKQGIQMETVFQARFDVTPSLAQHLTTAPLRGIRITLDGRVWTFEPKGGLGRAFHGEVALRARCDGRGFAPGVRRRPSSRRRGADPETVLV